MFRMDVDIFLWWEVGVWVMYVGGWGRIKVKKSRNLVVFWGVWVYRLKKCHFVLCVLFTLVIVTFCGIYVCTNVE